MRPDQAPRQRRQRDVPQREEDTSRVNPTSRPQCSANTIRPQTALPSALRPMAVATVLYILGAGRQRPMCPARALYPAHWYARFARRTWWPLQHCRSRSPAYAGMAPAARCSAPALVRRGKSLGRGA